MDRKQFLGAVFDEIEHHYKLFEQERKVYLALAAVAGLCLLVAAVVLIVWPPTNPAIAVLILGGSGLVAFASARSTVFFNSSISMVQDVVKRWSKLSEPEMVSTVDTLKKKSSVSVLLLAVSATVVLVSAVFALTRVWRANQALEVASEEAARQEVEMARWKDSFASAQEAYVALKTNATALHAAHVTRNHELVEVQATAQLPPAKTRAGTAGAGYAFTLALHSSPKALASFKRVRYQLPRPRGGEPVPDAQAPDGETLVVEDASTGFRASFTGNGCVPDISVTLELQDGEAESFVFDQCRSLQALALPAATAAPPATK